MKKETRYQSTCTLQRLTFLTGSKQEKYSETKCRYPVKETLYGQASETTTASDTGIFAFYGFTVTVCTLQRPSTEKFADEAYQPMSVTRKLGTMKERCDEKKFNFKSQQ